MLNRNKSPEEMIRRCEAIEKLEMECLHNDSRVRFINFPEVEFDLSAVHPVFLMSYALNRIYEAGEKEGRKELKKDIRELLFED